MKLTDKHKRIIKAYDMIDRTLAEILPEKWFVRVLSLHKVGRSFTELELMGMIEWMESKLEDGYRTPDGWRLTEKDQSVCRALVDYPFKTPFDEMALLVLESKG